MLRRRGWCRGNFKRYAHNNIVTSARVNASIAGSSGGVSTAGNVVISLARGWLLPKPEHGEWVGLQNYSKSWLVDINNNVVVDKQIVSYSIGQQLKISCK